MIKKIIITVFIFLLCNNSIIFSQTNITARAFYDLCYADCYPLASDIMLMDLRGMFVDTTGKSLQWSCKIVSHDQDRLYWYSYSGDSVVLDTITAIPIGIFRVDFDWIDSDRAIQIAEQNGGRLLRMSFPECKIFTYLWRYPAPPFYTVWSIYYDDYIYIEPRLNVTINALTEQIVSDLATDPKNDIIDNFILYNNYPNPFNNSTVFHFKLQKQSDVILKIYDISGQEIEQVINQTLNAATYNIKWQANTLSSGIYFYTLEVDGQSKTGKFVVIR